MNDDKWKERASELNRKLEYAKETSERRKEKIKSLSQQIKELEATKAELEQELSLRRDIPQYSRHEREIEREIYMKLLQRLALKLGFGSHCTVFKRAFENGELTYGDGQPMFDPDTLLININPRTGRQLDEEDHKLLLTIFGGEKSLKKEAAEHDIVIEGGTGYWYWKALEDYKEWKTSKSNHTYTELTQWVYNKGMEILPNYIDVII